MNSYLSKFGYFLSRVSRDPASNKLLFSSNITWCQLRHLAGESSGIDDRSIVRVDYFEQVQNRTKETYLDMVRIYKEKERLRRGHVEFIYSALKHMKEFGVEKDIEVYKSLVDVFPKGKMIPKNIFQVEFMHYPKHQQCAIDLLEQMEENGVIPDWDMEDQLMNAFGSRGYPVRRYWRMMYWMPKWRNASPFPLPRPLPSDSLLLAEIAIKRITEVDVNSQITTFKTSMVEESIDDTWIVSGQSDEQRSLLEGLPASSTLYVEGPYRIWLRNIPISYFTLSTDPEPFEAKPEEQETISVGGVWMRPSKVEKRSIHQQDDSTVLAVCATGTSSRDSLLSWLRCLQSTNPRLLYLPVLFRLEGSILDSSNDKPARLSQPRQSLPRS